MWTEAAEVYERAACEYQIAKSDHDASSCYVDAAKCRKTVSPSSAVDDYKKASLDRGGQWLTNVQLQLDAVGFRYGN